tara:strand:+ start:4796 stop:6529 length:1734 start_codon:yes stop_codon:yes gene_type:complete
MSSNQPQSMDITSLLAVVCELRRTILPSRFEKAQQPDPWTLQLGFRTLEGLKWIEICWKAEISRLVQIDPPNKEGAQSTLAKQLQHILTHMALIEIKQSGFERIVELSLAKRPGAKTERCLIVEIMGRHSNILLLDQNKKVITIGRQIRTKQSRVRPISTGDIYAKPPSLQGYTPSSRETFEEWKEKLCTIPSNLKRSLLKTYQGISPSLAIQLVSDDIEEANNLLEISVSQINDKQWNLIFTNWKQWLNDFEKQNLSINMEGPTAYRAWGCQKNIKTGSSIVLSRYYRVLINKQKINQQEKELKKILSESILSETSLLSQQKNLYLKSNDSDELTKRANDIMATAFPTSQIILNAQKLYNKAKKLRRSKIALKQRIIYHQERINIINEFLTYLDNLTNKSIKDNLESKIVLLLELKEEIYIYLNLKNKKRKNNQKSQRINPLTIRTPNGLSIQVGRNHRQNEHISFKQARNKDLWFHAQESPGSHVVLKSSNGIPSDKDLEIAADIAAHFSKASGNSKVPIFMVAINKLKRIPHSQPGTVRFDESEIIWGNPSRGNDFLESVTLFEGNNIAGSIDH